VSDAETQRKGKEEERRRLEAVEAELKSLRVYLGSAAVPAPVASEKAVQTDGESSGPKDSAGEGTESQVELLQRQVVALREIVAVMEAHMATPREESNGGGEEKRSLLLVERWRQEVFRAIVGRKAADVAVVEVERASKEREATLRETLRAVQCSAKVRNVHDIEPRWHPDWPLISIARRQKELNELMRLRCKGGTAKGFHL
jgi:hypothetical protein